MGDTKEGKKCKHCQSDIPKKAKICPNCKKKQGGIAKWAIIAFIALGVIGAAGGTGNGSESESENKEISNAVNSASNNISDSLESKTEIKNTQTPTPTEIAYEICSIDVMMEDLSSNALRAESNYQDKYIEVTGKLNVIDSDGKYISIVPDEQFAIMGIQCKIKNEEQKAKIIEKSIGDIVTVKGQITSIGEVIGYYMDLDCVE